MDKLTQQNTVLVEQVMEASNLMADQAQRVSTSLDFFTTVDTTEKVSGVPMLPDASSDGTYYCFKLL
jgi:hypothetical protein